jgi:hypothetical protein
MIKTKDLRDIIDEATKRASDVISDTKVPEVSIGRRNDTNGMLVFGIGLMFGALIGMVIAFLMTPYSGEQARQKLNDQVEKVRRQREEPSTNGGATYGATTPGYGPSTSSYERS